MFQLTEEEYRKWFQFETHLNSSLKHSSSLPYVFIEQKYINNLVIKNDERLTLVEKAIDKMTEKERHSLILYDGEIYDAYSLLIN